LNAIRGVYSDLKTLTMFHFLTETFFIDAETAVVPNTSHVSAAI